MKIGDIANKLGITTKSIRYYEKMGLITSPKREQNGYRTYSEDHLSALTLIKKARLIGFSIEECRNLLLLWASPHRKSLEVNAALTQKITKIDEQIETLQSMKFILIELSAECPNNENAFCPVISKLLDPKE